MLSQVKYIILGAALSLPAPAPALPYPPPARPDPGLSYLALGDSYTIGESVSEAERYPVQVMNLLNADHLHCGYPEIIATTGWTTADLQHALLDKPASLPYDLVTLLIGVNNQYQHRSPDEYRQQFSELLQQAILLAGKRPSHVTVLSIPDYSITPFAQASDTALIASEIDAFNAINRRLSMEYGVHYVDITGESRKGSADPSLIATDGLHFSGREYAIWAGLLEPVMKNF